MNLAAVRRPGVIGIVVVAGTGIVLPAIAWSQPPPPPAAEGSAKSATDLLNRRARLEIQRFPLDRALVELSLKSGVFISFSPSLLPKDQSVTCHCLDLTVGQALDRLLAETTLRFGELESQVLIFPERPGLGGPPVSALNRPTQPDNGAAPVRPVPPPAVTSVPLPNVTAAPSLTRLVGTVTDQATGRGIEAARVEVVGAETSAHTGRAGGFVLAKVPAGRLRVRVQAMGYRPLEDSVVVGPDATAEFALTAVPYPLAEIVATATGDQSKLALGNSVTRLAVGDLVASGSVTSAQDLLTGRVAGVTVLSDNGVLGAAGRIRVRGQSSASLSNDPLIYLDGVRVEASSPELYGTPGVGGARPSILNHLDPNEIESIEIVKGPSAATLYGTQAANGVIRIVTKHGAPGPVRWTAIAEQGLTQDPTHYPEAYFSAGHDPTTGQARACLPYQQAGGDCFIDHVYRRNLMEEPAYTLLKTGFRQMYGLQVSGGSEAVRYFLSSDLEMQSGTLKMPDEQVQVLEQERGVITIPTDQVDPSGLRKINLRGNLSLALGNRADLAISTGYVNGMTRFAPGGDDVSNPLVSAVIGATADPTAPSPYGFVPPNQGFARTLRRSTDRVTNGAQLHWRPNRIVEARAALGLDYTMTDDEAATAPGEGCAVCELDRLGLRAIDRYTNHQYSVDLGVTASFDLSRGIRSRSSLGAQYNRDALFAKLDRANVFPPGATTIDAGTIRSSSEATTVGVTLGTYLEEQVSFHDRLTATGAVRIDRNSAFGAAFRSATYPKLSVSWVIRDGAPSGLLNTMRLRGAFGASGLQPPPNAALDYYTPVGASLGGIPVPAVTLGGLGNPSLRPERSNELEVGADAQLFQDRASLELTYYFKRTTDAMINRNLPPSLGATATRMENLGTVTNQGFEVSLRARAVNHRSLLWDVALQVAGNRNRLESLGRGVPPIRGFGFSQVPGYPLFGFWLPRITAFRDGNGDKIIEPSEVTVSDTSEFAGSSIPTRSVSLANTIGFPNHRVRLGWLVDYQGGRVGHNVEQLFRCSLLQICREINDPTTPLEAQAKAVAGGAARGGWIEDASFLKFREVSIVFELPAKWARTLRSRSATISLTGRNLGLVTFGWSSWDPELNTTSSDGPSFTHSDQTPPRMFLLRLSLGR